MQRSDGPADDPYPFANSIPTDTRRSETADTIFTCLADPRRRLLIERVSEGSGPIVFEELVQHGPNRRDAVAPATLSNDERVKRTVALRQNHLPKLEEAGVVEVDYETNTVRESAHFDTATSLLEVV